MLYIGSSIMLIIAFVICKKTEKKLNILSSLAKAIIAYQCYLCMMGGVLTIFGLPVTAINISLINILFSLFLVFRLIKTKSYQTYHLDLGDFAFIFILAIIVTLTFCLRFTDKWQIVFETSDPGTHLKMAMDMVLNKAVDGMYLGQLINGLFIESMEGVYSGAFVYKSFIIQYGINFFLAGFVFWSTIRRYAENYVLRFISYGITIAYLFGYPYNDMLFGFVYLQMTITICCYLISVVDDYLNNEINFKIFGIMAGLGCLGVGVGYTLFAPIIWFSVLGCIMFKAHQEKWLINNAKTFLSARFITSALYVFALPAFITLWFTVIMPFFNNDGAIYVNYLNIEGYIYRNLFSDFWLFSLPAIYGYFYSIRTKKTNFIIFLTLFFIPYYFFFLYKMLNDEVSTYYFYKLNFLLWLIVLFLFMVGLKGLLLQEKLLFKAIIISTLFIGAIYATRFEVHYNLKNPNYMPFSDTEVFFRIYAHNYIYYQRKSQVPTGLIEVSNAINQLENNQDTAFIGYWLEQYWFEALTNIRLPIEWKHFSEQEMFEQFINGKQGEYAVITKDTELLSTYQDYIDSHLISEYDYAYIIKQSR